MQTIFRRQSIRRYIWVSLFILLTGGGIWRNLHYHRKWQGENQTQEQPSSSNNNSTAANLPSQSAPPPVEPATKKQQQAGYRSPSSTTALPHAEIVSIKMPDTAVVNRPIVIEVTVVNRGTDAKAGGISISFPDNPPVRMIHADTTKNTIYPVGRRIWSNTERKSIPSRYILAEAWQEPWRVNETHRFLVEATPITEGTLRVFVRATVTVPGFQQNIIVTPESGQLDQQGFPVQEYTVIVAR